MSSPQGQLFSDAYRHFFLSASSFVIAFTLRDMVNSAVEGSVAKAGERVVWFRKYPNTTRLVLLALFIAVVALVVQFWPNHRTFSI